ncbi:MAG: class I SAM-dependent methyltransferase [Clostridium sp.]|nr:class I SAM-dependent methyltransferase [Clostridium sp.]
MVKLIEKFEPTRYEFYEIEKKLAEYIIENYQYPYCQMLSQEADGRSLKATADESVDLVFASNIFSLITYDNAYRYLLEMIRICKKDGYVVFDMHTEDTMTESVLSNEQNPANTWRIFPQKVIEDIFGKRKMKLICKFKNTMVPGIGAENKQIDGDVIESWYIYKKENS